MKKQLILILAVAMVGWFVTDCQAQKAKKPLNRRIARDSVSLGDYKAVYYEVFNPSGDEKLNDELTIYRDGRQVASVYSQWVGLYNFATGSKKAKPVYHRDINKDGYDEIILLGRSGKTGVGTFHASVHTLKPDKFVDVTQFNLNQADKIFLEDIDQDSIPEIMFYDANFADWHAPLKESPMPLLIWKWSNNNYRIANYKFAKYLSNRLKKLDFAKLDEAVKKWDKNYNPKNEFTKYPPPMLWGYMLDYIYADNQAKADSILNEYWPKDIPGKDEFYAEFKQHLEDGFYWKGLQESTF